MAELTKEQQEEVLRNVVKAANDTVASACAIADEYGLEFRLMDQTYVGVKSGNGGERLTVDEYWEDVYYEDMDPDDPRYDERHRYSGWQNSSTFC